mmetsp:Transcript_36965/g.72689  ORF Transcript_36965/g.72689 Transcript_36965/m.72689 type:complete len:87 (+) Transcript_36965:754-1014(+)
MLGQVSTGTGRRSRRLAVSIFSFAVLVSQSVRVEKDSDALWACTAVSEGREELDGASIRFLGFTVLSYTGNEAEAAVRSGLHRAGE